MRQTKVGLGVCVAVIVSLALVGCQNPASATSAGKPAPVVHVLLNDFTIAPATSSIAAGKVTFQATNQGKTEHEFVILKTDLAPNALKVQSGVDKVDEDASGTSPGEIEDIAVGTTKTGTFDLPAGHYVLVCNVPGHYHLGMATAIDVK